MLAQPMQMASTLLPFLYGRAECLLVAKKYMHTVWIFQLLGLDICSAPQLALGFLYSPLPRVHTCIHSHSATNPNHHRFSSSLLGPTFSSSGQLLQLPHLDSLPCSWFPGHTVDLLASQACYSTVTSWPAKAHLPCCLYSGLCDPWTSCLTCRCAYTLKRAPGRVMEGD